MVNFKKTTKGITMIALIITILVLLVLATVTIRIMVNNGIIGTSRRGAEDYIVGQEKEAIHTGFQNYQQELELDENAELKVEGATVTTNAEDGWDIVFNTTGHAYHLKSDGIIEGDEIIVANQPTTPSQEGGDTEGGSTMPTETPLAVGDYIAYTYDAASDYSIEAKYSGYTSDQTITQTPASNMKWRVLSIDQDNVTLVSDESTEESVYLYDAVGYNNGVYLLNDICAKFYSNSKLGVTARSINIEDIEAQMSESGIEARNNFVDSYNGSTYGKTVGYGGGTYQYVNYPNICAQEKGIGINSNTPSTTGKSASDPVYSDPTEETSASTNQKVTVRITAYELSWSQLYDGGYKSQVLLDVIAGPRKYWVASRIISESGYSSYPYFGLHNAYGYNIDTTNLYAGNNMGGGAYYSLRLRPVVVVNANWISSIGGTASSPRSLTKT